MLSEISCAAWTRQTSKKSARWHIHVDRGWPVQKLGTQLLSFPEFVMHLAYAVTQSFCKWLV
jgi:hypothetical protein